MQNTRNFISTQESGRIVSMLSVLTNSAVDMDTA